MQENLQETQENVPSVLCGEARQQQHSKQHPGLSAWRVAAEGVGGPWFLALGGVRMGADGLSAAHMLCVAAIK